MWSRFLGGFGLRTPEKLYELAGSTPGPILEIGTYRGKSALLMALAMKDSRSDGVLYTLDVDRRAIFAAAGEARARVDVAFAERFVDPPDRGGPSLQIEADKNRLRRH